jgi:dTDP-4-amino-4,6-dideoxygalactose transaminase
MPRNQPVTAPGIPTLDLKRQYAEIQAEIRAAIERVCASQQFVLGPEVEALEQEVAQYVGAKHAVGCASGTDALWLALAAAGVGPGDQVITTPFSFFASASSIVRTGAEPVFADIEADTLNLDPAKVRALLESRSRSLDSVARPASGSSGIPQDDSTKTVIGCCRPERTKALLPVHLYGQCAEMTALQELSLEHNLPLIEDAAQAIGAKWDGKAAGSIGLSAAFSFYPTKNLSAYGDAGMVTTNDPVVADHMRRLRNHGSPERYLHTEFGWNARMDAIQAAVLRVKLKHIDDWNERRRSHAGSYTLLLQKAGLVAADSSTTGTAGPANPSNPPRFPIQVLKTSPHAFHIFHQYVIRARRRDELRDFLKSRGIGSEVYYPTPLHLQPVFAYLGYKEGDLPEAERAAKEVLALPMFPELTREEIEAVVGEIADFYS